MSRRDQFHDVCKNALIKAGWRITHDPYPLRRGVQKLSVDLGAELPIAAERDGRKIAVEVKSLLGGTEMPEFERALGQYILYRSLLRRAEPERVLYLAVVDEAWKFHFDIAEGRDLIGDEDLKLLVFDSTQEVILRWIEQANTKP